MQRKICGRTTVYYAGQSAASWNIYERFARNLIFEYLVHIWWAHGRAVKFPYSGHGFLEEY